MLQFVAFVPVYGIPHSNGRVIINTHININESNKLQEMISVQDQIKAIIKNARRTGDISYVFGDLQNMRDNCNNYYR
jgi:3-methyladenine DNA glycosylase Tag